MKLGLQNRVALITGASKGIGKAIAIAFARAGGQPCLVSRSEANLIMARDEVSKATGVTPLIIAGDVADPDIDSRATKLVLEAYGRIDILVNNAEGPPMGSFTEHDVAAWNSAYQCHLLAPIRFIRAVSPVMRTQGWGRIINISSVLAKEPAPAMILSATMRAGLAAFSKAASIELAPFNITLNTVCPSAVLTERMTKLSRIAAERQGKTYEEILDEAKKRIPAGRFSTPEEIANLVMFLSSEHSGYMTGLAIMVDGGVTKSIF